MDAATGQRKITGGARWRTGLVAVCCAAAPLLGAPVAGAAPPGSQARLRDLVPEDTVALAHAPSLRRLVTAFASEAGPTGRGASPLLRLALLSPLGEDWTREARRVGLTDDFARHLAALDGPAVAWLEASRGGTLLLAVKTGLRRNAPGAEGTPPRPALAALARRLLARPTRTDQGTVAVWEARGDRSDGAALAELRGVTLLATRASTLVAMVLRLQKTDTAPLGEAKAAWRGAAAGGELLRISGPAAASAPRTPVAAGTRPTPPRRWVIRIATRAEGAALRVHATLPLPAAWPADETGATAASALAGAAAANLLPGATFLRATLGISPRGLAQVARTIAPGAWAPLEDGLRTVAGELGLKLDEELLGSLGAGVTLAASRQRPSGGPIAAPALTLVLPIASGRAWSEGLARWKGDQEARGGQTPFRFEERALAGGARATIVAPRRRAPGTERYGETVLPGWARVGGALLLSTGGSLLQAAADNAAGAGRSLALSPRYRRAAALLADAPRALRVEADLRELSAVVREHRVDLAHVLAPEPRPSAPPAPPGRGASTADLDAWRASVARHREAGRAARKAAVERMTAELEAGCAELDGWQQLIVSAGPAPGGASVEVHLLLSRKR